VYKEPGKIGNLVIKNRFVRSATYMRMATEEGYVTNDLLAIYKNLAKGGVGLIITGYAYVHPSGKSFPGQLGADEDKSIDNLKRIASVIHQNDQSCKVICQLAHSGRQSYFLDTTLAPSAVLEPITGNVPKEMTNEEIDEITESFAKAAQRAYEAGFNGIQFHGAHGYLLSEFLSPYTNKRTDEYGGTIDNRIRIFEEIYKRTRDIVGKDFPILAKINGTDFLEGGLELIESKKIAARLSSMGFAAIEISGGMWEVVMRTKGDLGWYPAMNPESRLNINSKDKEAYHKIYAKEIKSEIKIPLILVGGMRSLDVIDNILTEGIADFVSLSRPLIREPDLPNKWLKGTGENTCKCISCNGCVGTVISGHVHCTQEKEG